MLFLSGMILAISVFLIIASCPKEVPETYVDQPPCTPENDGTSCKHIYYEYNGESFPAACRKNINSYTECVNDGYWTNGVWTEYTNQYIVTVVECDKRYAINQIVNAVCVNNQGKIECLYTDSLCNRTNYLLYKKTSKPCVITY